MLTFELCTLPLIYAVDCGTIVIAGLEVKNVVSMFAKRGRIVHSNSNVNQNWMPFREQNETSNIIVIVALIWKII